MEDELYKQQIQSQSPSRSSFAARQQPSPEVDPNAPTPLTNCYNVGDPGPGGGTIFAVPVAGSSNPNYYYEVGPVDLMLGSTSTQALNLTCRGLQETIINNLGVNHDFANTGTILSPNQFTLSWNTSIISQFPTTFDSITHNSNPGYFFPTAPNGINRITNIESYFPGQTLQDIINQNYGNLKITLQHDFNPQVMLNNPTGGFLTSPFFVILQVPTGLVLTATGAEWGANDRDFPTGPNFGDGRKNTDLIGALTQTAPPLSHPTLTSRSIAADLCLSYSTTDADGNDYIDWFLPSIGEFQEMKSALGDPASGAYILNLQTNTSNSEHLYWTSSSWITTDPARKSFSFAFNNDVGNFNLIRKCKTLSVRPIRRFECFEEPDPDPCDYNDQANYNPTCECVQFNYRDYALGMGNLNAQGLIGLVGNYGNMSGPFNSTPQLISDFNFAVANGFVPPNTNIAQVANDSFIGGKYFTFKGSLTDALGNSFTYNDFLDDSLGYTITMYNLDYTLIGKWHYEKLASQPNPSIQPNSPNSWSGQPHPMLCNHVTVTFENPTHLEGPSAIIDYDYWGTVNSPGSSVTLAFTKIEGAFNANLPPEDKFASACDIANDPYSYQWACLYANAPNSTWALPSNYNIGGCVVHFGVFNVNGNSTNKGYYETHHDCWAGFNNSFAILGYHYPASLSTCTEVCPGGGYNIGDIGPGGGVIVATPWMNQGTIVPDGADENNSKFYFELGPEDLTESQWGNLGLSAQAQQNEPGENEGKTNTDEMISNYSPIPSTNFSDIAFELCNNYSVFGAGGTTYDDWFLPSIEEWWFVRNNLPNKNTYLGLQSATTNQTYSPLNFDNLYWTSNYRDNIRSYLNYPRPSYGTPYASNPFLGNGAAIGGIIDPTLTIPGAPYNPLDLALASDLATEVKIDPATGQILSGDTVATEIRRNVLTKVRPMRKFTCDFGDAEVETNRSIFADKNAQRPIDTGPFSILGYFPLYDTIKGASDASPDNSGYHIHEFNSKEYFMPNGLIMNETQFHGDWPGFKREDITTNTMQLVTGVNLNGDNIFDKELVEDTPVVTIKQQDYVAQEIIQPQQEVVEPEQIIEPEQTTETEDTIEPEALPTPPPQQQTPPPTPPPPTYTPPSSGSGGGGGSY